MSSLFDSHLFESAASAGEDLEYSTAFSEFISMATPREERQVGEHVIPAQAPAWGDVLKAGCALLEKSRDLRILVKVSQAALQKHGMPGLSQSLALMAHWIENEWNTLYPLLEMDGDYDPLFRCNAIAEISNRDGIVRALRQASFLETPVGSVTISQAEHLLEGKSPEGTVIVSSTDQLSKMLIAEEGRNQDRLEAVRSISASLTTISSIFKSRLEPEFWPDIELLSGVVNRIARFVSTQLQGAPQEIESPEPGSVPQAPAPRASGSLPTMLGSRADAFKALALARDYFERCEPSHPATLLIRRIERMSGADFLAIIRDLMPESVHQLFMLAGITDDQM